MQSTQSSICNSLPNLPTAQSSHVTDFSEDHWPLRHKVHAVWSNVSLNLPAGHHSHKPFGFENCPGVQFTKTDGGIHEPFPVLLLQTGIASLKT
jgi:hypothetical protein